MIDAAAAALQERIRHGIPMAAAMDYRIVELAETQIRVEAPLAPNVNVHGTAFAGSLYALGILTAWGLCAHRIDLAGITADLVVAEAHIRYRAPVRGLIACRGALEPALAAAFIDDLEHKGRARTSVRVEIGRGPAARIDATMYASLTPSPTR